MAHDGKNCFLGSHSNRGLTTAMCPIFLEERRAKARKQFNEMDWVKREEYRQRNTRGRWRQRHDKEETEG